MEWSSLDSTGVRPLVDQWRGSRAADACEIDSLLSPSLADEFLEAKEEAEAER